MFTVIQCCPILTFFSATKRSPRRWELSAWSKSICLRRICEGRVWPGHCMSPQHWHVISCHPARQANFSATLPPPAVSDAAKIVSFMGAVAEVFAWQIDADSVIWASEKMWEWNSCTCQSTLLRSSRFCLVLLKLPLGLGVEAPAAFLDK